MAMSDFWGKAHTNNNIGFGHSGINDFGYGSIYDESESGNTDLLPNISPSATFKQRVLDDLGTFEAQQCLDDLINQGLFDSSNFVLTPNGYKAGKLYALKPENGDLDISWVRNGNATRVNKDGLIESVGNNVPRLDYTDGDCPSLLVEEQSTNFEQNSETTSPLSQYPALMDINSVTEINPFGLNSCISLIPNTTNSNNHRFGSISTAGQAVSGENINYSIFVKPYGYNFIRLGGIFGDEHADFNLLDGVEVARASNVNDTKIVELSGGWFRITVSYTFQNTIGNNNLYQGGKVFNNLNFSSYSGDGVSGILAFGVQVEKEKNTSYIPTNGSAVTRPADAPQSITPPTGTTEIAEVFEDGTTNTITTIPATYNIPFGRFKYILFN